MKRMFIQIFCFPKVAKVGFGFLYTISGNTKDNFHSASNIHEICEHIVLGAKNDNATLITWLSHESMAQTKLWLLLHHAFSMSVYLL